MAQRIANVAPIGSLLKGGRRETKTKPVKPKHGRARDNAHLEAIRQLPCVNPQCRRDPAGVAAHVRFACAEIGKPNPGMQAKPDDAWTLPLCQSCHQDAPDAQHKGNEIAFYARIGIDPLKTCIALYDASPNVEHMRAIIFTCHTFASLADG
ncbi:hypothetical protein I6F35_33445 [Bradyrhizobium sp. BRP22]|uniref:DUF968 domain-containing protein n=1 Tax=Bradyrhizobium sp. BRP22 TaxID=2793821 RepID=UPI001CD48CC0|nr:DUF968 domain-containing protein [Bradyrhizobium sp. BRP22]MCA1458040.1 hypothetical protein [Bradyrhizobium sp. BRP22]